MSFKNFIISFTDSFRDAWNAQDMNALADMLDDDIEFFMPLITFSNLSIEPDVIKGKKAFLNFAKKLTKNLPMKCAIVNRNIESGKVFRIKVHYYEIDMWCLFECTFSDYGRYKKLELLHYEDTHAKKITTRYVFKNVVIFKIKKFFSRKKK